MSDAALRAMERAGEALFAALGERDSRAIEEASATYRDAVDAVRAAGAWHATPALKLQMRDLRAGVDRLTLRVRDLTHASAHRLAALEAVGATALYERVTR